MFAKNSHKNYVIKKLQWHECKSCHTTVMKNIEP